MAQNREGNCTWSQRNRAMMDDEQYVRSSILDSLNNIFSMKDNIKLLAALAYDAVDKDMNGSLDLNELGEVLRKVAEDLNLHIPTDNDIIAVLGELDQDNDQEVSKEEFESLIVKVLQRMAESELEIENNANQELIDKYNETQ